MFNHVFVVVCLVLATNSAQSEDDVAVPLAAPRAEAIYFEGKIDAPDEAGALSPGRLSSILPTLPVLPSPKIPFSNVHREGDRWKDFTTLKVCFLQDRPVSLQVVNVASRWNGIANIGLDFGEEGHPRLCFSNPDSISEIRIAYDFWPPAGHWSRIGNAARKTFDQTAPTMNLKNFDGVSGDPPTEPEFSWIILHEFGHALGILHEYQNPNGGCDKEFDWEVLSKKWGSKDAAEDQLQLPKDGSAFGFTDYDAMSVMRYFYPPAFFKRGVSSPCYGEAVLELSDMDKQGLRNMYPALSSYR